MKIKLISDGTPVGTQVVDLDTGKQIENCVSAKFEVTVGELATVELKFVKVPVQVIGKFALVRPKKKK